MSLFYILTFLQSLDPVSNVEVIVADLIKLGCKIERELPKDVQKVGFRCDKH